jgi:hypothetical protein
MARSGERARLCRFRLYASISDQAGKMLKRAVVAPFRIIGKTAGRKFAGSQMVADTLTTVPLARTRFVTAVAGFKILFGFTFHHFLLSKKGRK